MHSKKFQWQILTAFAVLEFVGSIEGPNVTKFYDYKEKIRLKKSMNGFYWESEWQILHLAPSTCSVPQHHLTKPSIFHKSTRDFFNKINMFNMLLLHSFQSGSQK